MTIENGASPAAIAALLGAVKGGSLLAQTAVLVMVGTKPVDFREGAGSLAAFVRESRGADPFTGTVYVFRARHAEQIKLFRLHVAVAGQSLPRIERNAAKPFGQHVPVLVQTARHLGCTLPALLDQANSLDLQPTPKLPSLPPPPAASCHPNSLLTKPAAGQLGQ